MVRAFLAEYREAAESVSKTLAALEAGQPLTTEARHGLCRLAHMLRNAGLFLGFVRLAAIGRLLSDFGPDIVPDKILPAIQIRLLVAGCETAGKLISGIETTGQEPALATELQSIGDLAHELGLPWEDTANLEWPATKLANELSDEEKITRLLQEDLAMASPKKKPAVAADMIAIFVQDAEEILDHTEQDLLRLEREPARLNELLRHFHTLKGNSGLMGFDGLQQVNHRLENILQAFRDGQAIVTAEHIRFFLEAVDALRRRVAIIAKGGSAESDEDALWLERIDALRHEASKPEEKMVPAAKPEPAAAPTVSRGNLRVSVERLDYLNDLSGELVIAAAMVHHMSECRPGADVEQFNRALHRLDLITSELQDTVMAARMVPVETTFRRLTRLVRELSDKTGKPLDLQLTGMETEVDRRVAELMVDPLVHMVRNAVDHGIEPAAERRKAGKPATGSIRIEAMHRAGEVWIVVSDDGRGLQREKILAKARERGLVGGATTPADEDLLAVIFEPGVSTAETVTEVSGRGVGLDVVKRNVERLRGRVEVASTPGQGTVLTVKLPLTLAVIHGMLVRAEAEQYVLPILAIRESFQLESANRHRTPGQGEFIVVRGETIPLFRLANLFHIERNSSPSSAELVTVIEDGERRVALLLDELLGQQRVVVKSLGDALSRIPGVAGASILMDGRVRLILDVPSLIRTVHGRVT